jgi:competence protein ComGC
MCVFFARMARRHKCIQKLFAVIEFVIIFLVIAFLLTTTVPGLLRLRKRSQALQDYALATIIKSARKMDERAGESFGHSFDARFTDVTL